MIVIQRLMLDLGLEHEAAERACEHALDGSAVRVIPQHMRGKRAVRLSARPDGGASVRIDTSAHHPRHDRGREGASG